MLIEPTESEGLAEIDRFCDAMITIRQEAQDIIDGKQPKDNVWCTFLDLPQSLLTSSCSQNLLKNAPHTIARLTGEWDMPYTREQAVYPDKRLRRNKFWPASGRLDEVYGDTNVSLRASSLASVADLPFLVGLRVRNRRPIRRGVIPSTPSPRPKRVLDPSVRQCHRLRSRSRDLHILSVFIIMCMPTVISLIHLPLFSST